MLDMVKKTIVKSTKQRVNYREEFGRIYIYIYIPRLWHISSFIEYLIWPWPRPQNALCEDSYQGKDTSLK